MKTDKKKSKPKRKTKPKSKPNPKSKKETSEMEFLEAFFMTKPKKSKKKSTGVAQ